MVVGEVIIFANIFRDLFAGIRDIVGSRAGAYENAMRDARNQAMAELDAEALVNTLQKKWSRFSGSDARPRKRNAIK